MIGVILAAALLGYLILLLFEVKKIEVKGTVYTSEQEVLDWVQEDKYSSNSLYILWKYGSKETKQLPPIERTTVSLKSPWEVVVTVKEKTFEGCMDYDGGYLYFDESGTACLKSTEYIEGVPYIEGIELEKEKVKIGKSIPVKEKKIFEEISEITQVLNEKELTPDKIACEEENLILYFGNVRIQLGSGNFAVQAFTGSADPCKITGAVCRPAGSASSGEFIRRRMLRCGSYPTVRRRRRGRKVGIRRTSRRTPGQQNRQRCLRKAGAWSRPYRQK